MKKGFLIAAICVAFGLQTISAQDTEVKSHGDLFQGMSRTIPQGRVVLPYGLEVTFEKTVHLIFPAPSQADLSGGPYRPEGHAPAHSGQMCHTPAL